MKQWPTDTVPFFPWIRDLVHSRVKRPANNGVIQSNENHPVWMFSLGSRKAGVDSTGARVFLFVHLTVCAFCCVVLGSGPKPSIHRNYVMFDHVRSGFYVVIVGCFVFECGPNIRVWSDDYFTAKKETSGVDVEGMCLHWAFYVPDLISTTKTVGLVWYYSMLMGSNGNNTDFLNIFDSRFE